MTSALVSWVPIPFGDAGALATLVTMRQLVENARTVPWAVTQARQLVGADPAETTDDVIAKIDAAMQERFQFLADPAPQDRVSSPLLLLYELATTGRVRGDCDDAAILAAFLATVHGIGYRFRAVGFAPGAPLSHVYVILRGAWNPIPLDVTANAKQVVPAARRVLDFP